MHRDPGVDSPLGRGVDLAAHAPLLTQEVHVVDPCLVEVDDSHSCSKLGEHEPGVVLPQNEAAHGVAEVRHFLDSPVPGADVVPQDLADVVAADADSLLLGHRVLDDLRLEEPTFGAHDLDCLANHSLQLVFPLLLLVAVRFHELRVLFRFPDQLLDEPGADLMLRCSLLVTALVFLDCVNNFRDIFSTKLALSSESPVRISLFTRAAIHIHLSNLRCFLGRVSSFECWYTLRLLQLFDISGFDKRFYLTVILLVKSSFGLRCHLTQV